MPRKSLCSDICFSKKPPTPQEEYLGDDISEYTEFQNGQVTNTNDNESNDHEQASHGYGNSSVQNNFDSYKIVYDNKNGSGELYMY